MIVREHMFGFAGQAILTSSNANIAQNRRHQSHMVYDLDRSAVRNCALQTTGISGIPSDVSSAGRFGASALAALGEVRTTMLPSDSIYIVLPQASMRNTGVESSKPTNRG